MAVGAGAAQAVQWLMDSTEDQEADVEAADLLTLALRDKPLRVHNHLPVVAQPVAGDIPGVTIQTCHNILVQAVVVQVVLVMMAEMADQLQVVKVV